MDSHGITTPFVALQRESENSWQVKWIRKTGELDDVRWKNDVSLSGRIGKKKFGCALQEVLLGPSLDDALI